MIQCAPWSTLLTSSNVFCVIKKNLLEASRSLHSLSQQAFIDIIHLISQARSLLFWMDGSSLACLHLFHFVHSMLLRHLPSFSFAQFDALDGSFVFFHPQCAFISSSSRIIFLGFTLPFVSLSLPHRRLLALQSVRNDRFLLFRSLPRAPSTPSSSLYKAISRQSPSLLDWFSTFDSFFVSFALLLLLRHVSSHHLAHRTRQLMAQSSSAWSLTCRILSQSPSLL